MSSYCQKLRTICLLMKFGKRKVLFFSIIGLGLLTIVCLSLILYFQGRDSSDKPISEICVLKKCLKEGARDSSCVTACVSKSCVIFGDVQDYKKVCVPIDCSTYGNKNISDEVCIDLMCITPKKASKNNVTDKVCLTPECVAAASNMIGLMDQNTNPCEDFYGFSCGGFSQKYRVPEGRERYTTADVASEKISLFVNETLSYPVKASDSDALKKAKVLYTSCIDAENYKKLNVDNLKLLLSSKGIGVMPVLESNWNDCRVDLEWRMAKLNSRWVDSFFHIDIEPHPRNRKYYSSVFVSPPLIEEDCGDYDENSTSPWREEYKDLMRRVLRLLGAPKKNIEDDISSILQFDAKYCNATELSRTSKRNSNRTIQDLTSIAPQINWSRWFSIIISEVGLNSHINKAPIYMYNVEKSVEDLIELLHNTSSRTLANYLCWKFVLHHLEFLGQSFQQVAIVKDQFHFHMNNRMPKWKQCVKYVEKMMAFALFTPLRLKLTSDLGYEVDDVICYMKSSLIDTLNRTYHMTDDEKMKGMNKIDDQQLELFYPEEKERLYEDFYIQVKNLGYSFLENGLKVSLHYIRKAFEAVIYGKSVYDFEYSTIFSSPFTADIWSAFSKNYTVIYPPTLLSSGITSKQPKYLNFASFGTLVGHELTHGFDFPSISGEWDFHHEPQIWTIWSKTVDSYIKRRSNCFAEQLTKSGTGYSYEKRIQILYESIADNQAVQEAYKAYNIYVNVHEADNKALPGLINYTVQQLFFMKYAQLLCSSDLSSSSWVHVNRQRVNNALKNIDAFSKAFSCRLGSKMNPEKKCKNLW